MDVSLISESTSLKQYEVKIINEFDVCGADSLIKLTESYDFVVFHSLFLNLILKFKICLNKKLLKKIVWIGFGADIYECINCSKKISIKLNALIGKNCKAFVGVFPPDCEKFKRFFPKSKADVYYAPYYGTEITDDYKCYSSLRGLTQTKKNGNPIYIQVGHSARPMLKHMEVLSYLKKYRNENIVVWIPLSYGDMDYAHKVKKYAAEIFNSKAVFLDKLLPTAEYFKMLEKIDIAIFNSDRQIGLGNIHRFIFRNVKLYLRKNSVMYDFFAGRGVPVQAFEEIKDIDFNAFTKEVYSDDSRKFMEFINTYFDVNAKVSKWKKIYSDLRCSASLIAPTVGSLKK